MHVQSYVCVGQMEFLWEQHKRTSATSGPVDLENETQDLMGMTSIMFTGSKDRNTLFPLLRKLQYAEFPTVLLHANKPVDNGSFYYEMI